MADHIKIRPAGGTWVVRAAGAVLGETTRALELIEGDYPPVLIAKSGTFNDAAWSYETPKDGVKDIAGYLAFFGGKVAVEQL